MALSMASVQVSNNGTTFTTIASSTSPAQLPLSGVYVTAVRLGAFAGQTVLIRFSFDTLDGIVNNFEDGTSMMSSSLRPPPGTITTRSSASADDVVSAALKNLSGSSTNVFLEDCAVRSGGRRR